MIETAIESVVKHWWVFLVRGVLAILFGCIAFARPGLTLGALVLLFGAWALVDGIMTTVAAPAFAGTRHFWWLLLDGVLGIVVGVLTFTYPPAAAASLLLLLALWLTFGGVFRIGAAIELRKELTNEWALVLSGLFSIAAGFLTVYRPNESAVAWMWVIGTYAILYGILMITVGMRVHQFGKSVITGQAAMGH